MSAGSFDQNELLQLLGAVRDEQITAEQLERLEGILTQSAEARRFYVRFLTIHGLLEQAAVAVCADASAGPTPGVPTARPAPRAWRRSVWAIAGMAAAVLVGLSIWWVLSNRPDDRGPPGKSPAFAWNVTPTGNAQFDRLSPTSGRLVRGEVRIQSVKLDVEPGRDAEEPGPMIVETPAGQVTINGSDVLIGTHEITPPQEKGEQAMKRFTRVLVLAGVATLMNQQGAITGDANSLLAAQPNLAPAKQIVQANTDFAVDLFRQLAKQEAGKNVFFSPYSVSVALAMAAEGARGATAEEMGKVLHFPKAARRIGADAQLIPWQTALIHTGLAKISRDLIALPKKGAHPFDLRIANALWGERTFPFRKQFVETLNDSYRTGGVFPCDFAANPEKERVRINDWVADQTNKRIKNLLPNGSLQRDTRLVLTNAIYFKGDWVQKFDRKSTKAADFTTQAGQRIKTPMMFGAFHEARFAFIGAGDATESLRLGKADNLRLVELPYRGGLSMVLIAPDNVGGLPKLESRLNAGTLNKWIGQLQPEKKVEVSLPRFKFTTAYDLPDVLKQLGMVCAFRSPGPDGADFSGMSQSGLRELALGAVVHKAFVAVNEEGTEAAAATGVVGMTGPAPKPAPKFAGDRPFLFLIRDQRSGTILFMGRVADAAGVANNDLSEAQEQSIKLARTTPTKHPLYQRLKNAAGVAIVRTYRDPSGLMELKADRAGRTILQCRIVLDLKGGLKTGSLPWLTLERKVNEAETGQAFVDFFSPSYTTYSVLAVYRRDGGKAIVEEVIEVDEAARLIVANLYAIPVERLSGYVERGK
ncbi:MAG: serpin family protein [Planctomycetes bacterium]|nr:serpin family protein [Planctomycetota bacterium]